MHYLPLQADQDGTLNCLLHVTMYVPLPLLCLANRVVKIDILGFF
jgi:hypothetical protein